MKIEIEVTEDDIKQALERQVRVTMGHLFQSTEIISIIKKQAKEVAAKFLLDPNNDIYKNETLKNLYLQELKKAMDVKITAQLKGLLK